MVSRERGDDNLDRRPIIHSFCFIVMFLLRLIPRPDKAQSCKFSPETNVEAGKTAPQSSPLRRSTLGAVLATANAVAAAIRGKRLMDMRKRGGVQCRSGGR